MAKYQVECPTCEETRTVQLFGKNSDREYKLRNWDWTCAECEEKALVVSREKASREAAAANVQAGRPALVGSEKQIAWAEQIRNTIIDGSIHDRPLVIPSEEEIVTRLKDLKNRDRLERHNEIAVSQGFDDAKHAYCCQRQAAIRLTLVDSAHWWIENRSKGWRVLVTEISEKIAKESGVVDSTPEAEEAKAEAMVRPETPVTETVAEIRPLKNSIEVIFPEKRDDFWQIIKKQLGYTWSGGCWKKSITATTTPVEDMVAETGHQLLAAGFIIRIFDKKIRTAAIDGNYLADMGRWIAKRKSGEYAGWFAINWREDSDSLYQAARKLTGSKWSNPSVVVRPEHFEQVLDFADLYEFSLSTGAEGLVGGAQAAKDIAMTANVKSDNRELPQPGSSPPVLDVPTSVDVADEFKD